MTLKTDTHPSPAHHHGASLITGRVSHAQIHRNALMVDRAPNQYIQLNSKDFDGVGQRVVQTNVRQKVMLQISTLGLKKKGYVLFVRYMPLARTQSSVLSAE